MTQVLIQTKNFQLTEPIKNWCQKYADKLTLHPEQGEKMEFYLSVEGRGDGAQAVAKIKIIGQSREVFVEVKGNDLYQVIREGSKKARQQYHEQLK